MGIPKNRNSPKLKKRRGCGPYLIVSVCLKSKGGGLKGEDGEDGLACNQRADEGGEDRSSNLKRLVGMKDGENNRGRRAGTSGKSEFKANPVSGFLILDGVKGGSGGGGSKGVGKKGSITLKPKGKGGGKVGGSLGSGARCRGRRYEWEEKTWRKEKRLEGELECRGRKKRGGERAERIKKQGN